MSRGLAIKRQINPSTAKINRAREARPNAIKLNLYAVLFVISIFFPEMYGGKNPIINGINKKTLQP